jgi:hypothetical protein
MAGIGIVGSGIAGLQLGLFLQQHDVAVTIYTETSADDIAAGRLPNTVGHHRATLERERALGVHFWDASEYGYDCHHHYVGGEHPLFFPGFFKARSSSIDYRLYLPRLTQEYEERGGELVVCSLAPEDVERLSGNHDLMVVCSGRGGLSSMFARRSEKSPYDRPQRGSARVSTTASPAPTPSASASRCPRGRASSSSYPCIRATGTSACSCSSASQGARWRCSPI